MRPRFARTRTAVAAVALSLILAPAALAGTETARSGDVTATFTFHGSYPHYRAQLTIARAGQTVYDKPVFSKFCSGACTPVSRFGGRSSLRVIDLARSGEPDVVLDLYSGGAHCCSIEQVFSFDATAATYVKTEHNFGDPGARIADLGHDDRYEFLTADDSFAYAFTDFAASGLPIQVLAFSDGHFINVTRSYPSLIARDAAKWLVAFKTMAKEHYDDSVGVIAAWAADEDMLGHDPLVKRYLAMQLKAGHLNSGLRPAEPSGRRFVDKLRRFLRARGYLRG